MDYLQDYRLSKLPKKLQKANFKRKIEAGESSTAETILKRYRYEFPNVSICKTDVAWKHCDDLHILYHIKEDKPCFLMSDTMKPVLIGNTVKKFNYKLDVWTPDNLPKLGNGALLSIFKHLLGWELTQLRLVCKEWNRLITNQSSHWELSKVPSFVKNYWKPNLSPFNLYIQSMFINISDEAAVAFFFKNPEFFRYICSLLIGKTLQMKRRSNVIMVGRYSIYRKRSKLLCDRVHIVSIQIFLDAFRQSIV